MADYINDNIISQAYIHVEMDSLELQENFEKFKNRIREFTRTRTSFFLSPDTHVEIEFEKGSLKFRATVFGIIFFLMEGVAKYKDFREGIELIYSDAKRLSEYIISESLYETKAKHDNVIRLEALTGIIFSIKKVINQLEHIKHVTGGAMLALDIAKKIKKAKREIDKLLNNISKKNDRKFIKKDLFELANRLPLNPIAPKDETNTPTSLIIYRNERKQLL